MNIFIIKKFDYLSEILNHIKKLVNGDYNIELKIKGKGSFSELAQNLNQISSMNKDYIIDTLKSDLICIRLTKDLSSEYNIELKYLLDKLDSMKYFLNLNEDNFELNSLVIDNINFYKTDFDKRELVIKKNLEKKIDLINMDKKLIDDMIKEILENILKYSMEGSNIYIQTFSTGKYRGIYFKNVCKEDIDIKDIRNKGTIGIRCIENISVIQNIRLDIDIEASLFKVTCIF